MDTRIIRICVPVCERSADLLEAVMPLAGVAGNITELRLDCLDQDELNVRRINDLLRQRIDQPTIVTFRPAEQGGHRDLDNSARLEFWRQLDSGGRLLLFDIELDVAREFASSSTAPLPWDQVICSHHDFSGIPPDLEQIYERLARTPARILKIAVQAQDVVDCLAVFNLLERARQQGRELIAIAMGEAGLATRVLGPSRGSFLTYGALGAGRGTAPGQTTANELRELYRIERIDRQTQIMGLMGMPVSHSVSPQIHNAAFNHADLSAVYLPFAVHETGAFLRRMVHPRTREMDWNLRGLSITAPHKFAVIPYLDSLDPAAQAVRAVNTIVSDADQLRGYNTDVTAILRPVKEKLGALRDLNCAVIGAGGAASAALWSLKNEGARATLFGRNQLKARAVANRFGADCAQLDQAQFQGFDLVINATPLGTRGPLEDQAPANSRQLRGARLAYDLVYNPLETAFMRQASEAGCASVGGLAMLVFQAAEQFELWTGIGAPLEVMSQAAALALSALAAEN